MDLFSGKHVAGAGSPRNTLGKIKDGDNLSELNNANAKRPVFWTQVTWMQALASRDASIGNAYF